MKKTLLLLCSLSIITISAYSQKKVSESVVPQVVKAKFNKLYPSSKVEYWSMEGANYVAEFMDQKKEMTVFISPDGKTYKTEMRIHPSELPREAKEYIAKHYPGKKITDAVTSADGDGNRIYEAEVNELDLIFDGNGKYLKSTRERPVD
jgi:hypothetical protein